MIVAGPLPPIGSRLTIPAPHDGTDLVRLDRLGDRPNMYRVLSRRTRCDGTRGSWTPGRYEDIRAMLSVAQTVAPGATGAVAEPPTARCSHGVTIGYDCLACSLADQDRR